MKDIFKSFRKTVGSYSAKESPLAKITGMIDTGNYAINRALCGSIHGGIPEGRLIDLYGESQSGKSWLAANCIINALTKHNYQRVFYFDSEAGALFKYIESKGVDLDLIEHVPVHSIEDCTIKLVPLYDALQKAAAAHYADPDKNEMPRVLCVLDSFGMLASEKIIDDAEKGKTTSDMGKSAKMKNEMITTLAMRIAESNCGLIVINHIYRDPSALFPSKILKQPGGERLQYCADVQLQMSKLLIKSSNDDYLTGLEEDDDDTAPERFFKGNKISVICPKNRAVPPGYETNLYIDFRYGPAKYDGLIEDAVKFGFIEEVRGGYIVPSYSTKRIPHKVLVKSDEIWDTFIEDFDKKSVEMLSYSNDITSELNQMEQEIEKD